MATSQNGWSVYTSAPSGRLPYITGRVRPGDVEDIFNYLCKRFDAEVENIRQDWSWGWAYRAIRGKASGYSNHASGTAIDLNAPAHPLGKVNTFSASKRNKIRAILRDLEGVVRWGGDYSGRKDDMHFEINANSAAVARVAKKVRGGNVSRPTVPADPTWKWNPDQKSDLAPVQEQFQIAAGRKAGKIVRYHGVAHIQNALNVKAGARLTVDGICGAKTVAAWKRWEEKKGGTGWSTTPDETSLRALGILYRFVVPEKEAPKPTPPKPAPVRKLVKVMTWNVENKGAADAKLDRAEVIELLGERQPHYFAGQELYNCDLSDIPGYQTYQAWDGYSSTSENRAQAILVRNDVALKLKKALPMKEEWVGPKMGIEKDPRVHRYVVGNKYETNIPVGTFHVPFGKVSVDETKQATIKWLKEMEAAHGVAFAVGDWNSLAADLQAKVGTPAGAKVDGGGVDKIVFLGAKLVDSENLGKRGRSDHDVKEWTFEITG